MTFWPCSFPLCGVVRWLCVAALVSLLHSSFSRCLSFVSLLNNCAMISWHSSSQLPFVNSPPCLWVPDASHSHDDLIACVAFDIFPHTCTAYVCTVSELIVYIVIVNQFTDYVDDIRENSHSVHCDMLIKRKFKLWLRDHKIAFQIVVHFLRTVSSDLFHSVLLLKVLSLHGSCSFWWCNKVYTWSNEFLFVLPG
jgi:hypothetical protein